MYEPERLLENRLVPDLEPRRTLSTPPPAEFYNSADDSLEQRDIAADHPEVLQRMTSELET